MENLNVPPLSYTHFSPSRFLNLTSIEQLDTFGNATQLSLFLSLFFCDVCVIISQEFLLVSNQNNLFDSVYFLRFSHV